MDHDLGLLFTATSGCIYPQGTFRDGEVLLRHQKRALAWMLKREQQKPAGGILADDQGVVRPDIMVMGLHSRIKSSLGTLLVLTIHQNHSWLTTCIAKGPLN